MATIRPKEIAPLSMKVAAKNLQLPTVATPVNKTASGKPSLTSVTTKPLSVSKPQIATPKPLKIDNHSAVYSKPLTVEPTKVNRERQSLNVNSPTAEVKPFAPAVTRAVTDNKQLTVTPTVKSQTKPLTVNSPQPSKSSSNSLSLVGSAPTVVGKQLTTSAAKSSQPKDFAAVPSKQSPQSRPLVTAQSATPTARSAVAPATSIKPPTRKEWAKPKSSVTTRPKVEVPSYSVMTVGSI